MRTEQIIYGYTSNLIEHTNGRWDVEIVSPDGEVAAFYENCVTLDNAQCLALLAARKHSIATSQEVEPVRSDLYREPSTAGEW
jgi:hypothetical protein